MALWSEIGGDDRKIFDCTSVGVSWLVLSSRGTVDGALREKGGNFDIF